MQPRIPSAFFAARPNCWLTFHLLATRTLRSLSAKLPSGWVANTGLFPPSAGILHLTLLNFIKFLAAHLASLLRTLWMVTGVSVTPPSFVLPSGLLRVCCAPLPRSLVTRPCKGWAGTKAPGTLLSRAADKGWLASALPASALPASSTLTLPGVACWSWTLSLYAQSWREQSPETAAQNAVSVGCLD